MRRLIICGVVALAMSVAGFANFIDKAQAKEPESIRIGYAIALSGPYAPGAGATQWPNYKLWAKDVNDAGGIYLSKYDKRVPVELIEYDDQSSIENVVRLTEKMMLEDELDFVLAPWGTAMHVAVAPLYQKHGYPLCAVTAATEKMVDFGKRWPNVFWTSSPPSWLTKSLVELVVDLVNSGKINNKVAMISVADQFGAEMRAAVEVDLEAAGLDVVYNKSYPLGVADLAPQLQEIMRLGADSFFAMSYPPDAMLITGQSIGLGFNPKIWFGGVGPAFAFFKGAFGPNSNGLMGYGAWDPTPDAIAWLNRHVELHGYEPDRGASIQVYACMEILQAAIEETGEIDREKVIELWRTNTFDTIMGPVKFENNVRVRASQYFVGQWQGDLYQPVTGGEGTTPVPVQLKPDFVVPEE